MSDNSTAYALLHPRIQEWVHEQGWQSLREAQERAIPPILSGARDVIISVATAGGKTEAAFLPICSVLAAARGGGESQVARRSYAPTVEPDPPRGIEVLYVSPLKALINDQFDRLELLCHRVAIPVHRWHGDVGASAKQKAMRGPSGVLIITPESLEASFVNRGTAIAGFFGGLRYVVIDELHVFLTSPRGAQLQSLLNRLEGVLERRVPRVGLSATLGDLQIARSFIRPRDAGGVEVIEASEPQDIKLQVRGYLATRPLPPSDATELASISAAMPVHGDALSADRVDIAEHLFRTLRGTDNHLVFANSRQSVEMYADLLRRRCEENRLPNAFWPHHGNLAKDVREDVEALLKGSRPVTAICTSTLEMGIDIGSIASIAQVGVPPSVASLRQRLGRSGRRGKPPVLRIYVSEDELTRDSGPVDQLRCDTVEVVAMVQLLLSRWLEPPDDPGFNYSTLIQQILSLIAQLGGVQPLEAYRALCIGGPFEKVDQSRFVALLRAMAAKDLVVQSSDNILLHGQNGEQFVNHHAFYAAFATQDEWRLAAGGRTLGTLPIDRPLSVDSFLIFAGRRWRVAAIDSKARVLDLVHAPGGLLPAFGGSRGMTGNRVRQEMRIVYEANNSAAWLNVGASRLLAEGRAAWRRLGLSRRVIVPAGRGAVVFPWKGDRALITAAHLLTMHGVQAAVEGPALTMQKDSPVIVAAIAKDILERPLPDAAAIARTMENVERDKWDWVLTSELLAEATAARVLDVEGAREILEALAQSE